MKIGKLVILSLFVLIVFCSKENDKKRKEENIFVVYDSLSLNYPDSLFPKKIIDIAWQNDYIYVLNGDRGIKYPLVKFTKNGELVKAIGKRGKSPKEYNFPIQNIFANHEYIGLFTIGINKLLLLKNNKIVKNLNIDSKFKVTGISFIDTNNFIVSTFGDSPKHMVILDSTANVVETLQNFPENSDFITHGGSYVFINGLFKRNNVFYSHHGYPPYIYKTEKINDKYEVHPIVSNLKLDNVNGKDPKRLKNDMDNNNISLYEYMKSLDIIYMIYAEDNFIVGIFSGNDKRDHKKGVYVFGLKDGNKIIEKKCNIKKIGDLFVYDNGLARARFYKKDNSVKVKLYFYHINKKLFEFVER